MLFYRYISENLSNYINKDERDAGNPDFDYAELSDEEAEQARQDLVITKGFFILPSELFENVRKRAAEDEMESAYNATSRAMVLTYWNVGRRIVEQEQNGNQRAEYGIALIDALAAELTEEYGKSYSKRNLQYFRKFYQ